MAPVNTWNMCKPVIVKKVAPNSGVGSWPSVVVKAVTHSPGNANGCSPSWIKWFHSVICSTRKARPKKIVARIHFRALALSPRAEADTPKTIVRLDESRQNVISEAKRMLGLNGNGVGQTFEARR